MRIIDGLMLALFVMIIALALEEETCDRRAEMIGYVSRMDGEAGRLNTHLVMIRVYLFSSCYDILNIVVYYVGFIYYVLS